MAYIKPESDFFLLFLAIFDSAWLSIMHLLCQRLKVTCLGTRLDSGKVFHVTSKGPFSLPLAACERPISQFYGAFF